MFILEKVFKQVYYFLIYLFVCYFIFCVFSFAEKGHAGSIWSLKSPVFQQNTYSMNGISGTFPSTMSFQIPSVLIWRVPGQ